MKTQMFLVICILMRAEALNRVSKRDTLREYSRMLITPKTCADLSSILTGFACPLGNLCDDPSTSGGECGAPPAAYQCNCKVNSDMKFLYELSENSTPGTEIDVMCPSSGNFFMFVCSQCKCATAPTPLPGFTCTRRNPTTSEKTQCPTHSTGTDAYDCCTIPCSNTLLKCVQSSSTKAFLEATGTKTNGKLCYTKICCS